MNRRLLSLAAIVWLSMASSSAQAPAPRQDPWASYTDGEKKCQQRLFQLAMAVHLYADMHDRMPPMATMKECRVALKRFQHDADCFTCPVTGQPYSVASSLNRKPTKVLSDRHFVPVAWDTKVHSKMGRCIAYMNGASAKYEGGTFRMSGK
jgi:hypothetical protein